MSDRRGTLALDVATNLGWCFGEFGRAPIMGSVRLMGNGAEDGAIGCSLIDWLADRITICNPVAVHYEAALPGGKQSSINAAQIALGLAMCVKVVCWRREVRCYPGNVQRVRAQVIGAGNCDKPAVVAWCEAQGWRPKDFDAADAAALWAYAVGMRAPGRRAAA